MLSHPGGCMQLAGDAFRSRILRHVHVCGGAHRLGRQLVLKRWKVAPGRLLPTFDMVDMNLFLSRPAYGHRSRNSR